MKAIFAVSHLTLKEYFRKRLFIVTLLGMAIVAGTGLLSNPFTLGAQTRLMRDLALLFIEIFCIILAIGLGATALPNEIERKTLYPFLAKPMSRGEYVWGKFLAVVEFVAINALLLGAELFLVLVVSSRESHGMVFVACFLIFLEAIVIAALALWFSTFATAPVSFSLAALVAVLGSLSHAYALTLTYDNSPMQWLLLHLKSIVPYFNYFSIRSAVTHDHPVSLVYIVATTVYGILYVFLAMLLTEISFTWKDL